MRDSNKPKPGVSHTDGDRPRDLDTGGTGEKARDGYMRIARRPRSRYFDNMVSEDRADMIESPYDEPMGMPIDPYED